MATVWDTIRFQAGHAEGGILPVKCGGWQGTSHQWSTRTVSQDEASRFIILKQVSKIVQSNLTLKSLYFSALTVQGALSDGFSSRPRCLGKRTPLWSLGNTTEQLGKYNWL